MKEEVFWKNPGYTPRKPLSEDIDCDVLIVGGGVLGVTLAYFLGRQKDVVLVEKETVAHGATGRAAGSLSPEPEFGDVEDYFEKYGKEKALRFWYTHVAALKSMQAIVKRERIKCNFEECGGLHAEFREEEVERVLDEYKVSKKLHRKVELLFGKELEKEVHSKAFKYALRSHRGCSLNPLMYAQNLSRVIEKKRVRVFERTPVERVRKNVAFTPGGRIRFKTIVYSTDVPKGRRKVATIAVSKKLTKKQKELIGLPHHERLWGASTRGSYFYTKFTKDERLLVGYGDRATQSRSVALFRPQLRQIKRFIAKVFPDAGLELEYAWSGVYGFNEGLLPHVKFSKNKVELMGAGTQVTATMMARYAANRLRGRKQALDVFFR